MAKVEFKRNEKGIADFRKRFWQGCVAMGYDMATESRNRAPVLTGNLKASVRLREVNSGKRLEVYAGGTIGGINVDYALLRNFKNNKHPNTTHYMEKGAAAVINGNWQSKYFKGVL